MAADCTVTGHSVLFQFHIKALSSLARLRQLNVRICTPRRLNPRRLEIILDLKLVLLISYANELRAFENFHQSYGKGQITPGKRVVAVQGNGRIGYFRYQNRKR
jgi:hypothetical protein